MKFYASQNTHKHTHMFVHTAETLSQRKREELRGAGGKEEQMMKERNSQCVNETPNTQL